MATARPIEDAQIQWLSLRWILLAGAAIRLIFVFLFSGTPIAIDDAREYNTIATNLVERGEFAAVNGELTSIRPPLYPGTLALVYRITGLENHTAVRLIQSVIGLLTVVVVYQLALAMYGRTVATWSAVAVCFYPSLLFMGTQLLTEVLFTFLVCCFCWWMLKYLMSGRVGWLLGLGVTLGLATLTRSVLWLFPPFLIVFLVWAIGRREKDRPPVGLVTRAAIACIPVAIFCLVITPWSIRNTKLQKTFTTIDVMGGRNVMMGNYEYTPLFRAWDAISASGEQAWYRILAKENPSFASLTQGQRDKLAMKRGLKFIVQHPLLTAQRDLVKFANFWQLERTVAAGIARGYWGKLPRWFTILTAAIVAGAYAIGIILGIYGFILTRPSDPRLHWFLLLLVGFVCAAHTAVFAHERYRLPLMPLVLIYSASAVVQWGAIWERRRSAGFLGATALCLLVVASWVGELALVDWPRIQTGLM